MITRYFNFHLIDGTGAKVQENAEFYVENDRLVEPCQAEEQVDFGGAYVYPGLIEAHVHITEGPFALRSLEFYSGVSADYVIQGVKNLETILKQGVTFIRDVGTANLDNIDVTFKKHLASGLLKGPGMHSSGPLMKITGAVGRVGAYCDGVDECRKTAREILIKNPEWVKMAITGGVKADNINPNAYTFDKEEIAVVVHEAHKAGKRVAVHAQGTIAIRNALFAGVDSIEHGTYINDESIDIMAQKGTWLVPTFAINHHVMSKEMPEKSRKILEEVYSTHAQSVKKAYEKGVKIGAGTDLVPHIFPYQIQQEIACLKKFLDISLEEAIKIATKNNSELLEINEDYGTLELGKVADFVVINANPFEDVENLKKVKYVYQKGNLVTL